MKNRRFVVSLIIVVVMFSFLAVACASSAVGSVSGRPAIASATMDFEGTLQAADVQLDEYEVKKATAIANKALAEAGVANRRTEVANDYTLADLDGFKAMVDDNVETNVEINDIIVEEAAFASNINKQLAVLAPTATHVAIQTQQSKNARRNMWSLIGASFGLTFGVTVICYWFIKTRASEKENQIEIENNRSENEILEKDAAAARARQNSKTVVIGGKHMHLHYTGDSEVPFVAQELTALLPPEPSITRDKPRVHRSGGKVQHIDWSGTNQGLAIDYLTICADGVGEDGCIPANTNLYNMYKHHDGFKSIVHPTKSTEIRRWLVEAQIFQKRSNLHYLHKYTIGRAIQMLESGQIKLQT